MAWVTIDEQPDSLNDGQFYIEDKTDWIDFPACYHNKAGGVSFADGHSEFLPRDTTITAGDSVVWGSTGFHSVTFNPLPPAPALNLLETLPDGTQAIINNPQAFDPTKPSAVYDPTRFFSSGNLSQNQPNGTAWTLTFDTPGVYEYYCSVHLDLGMKGTITVLAR